MRYIDINTLSELLSIPRMTLYSWAEQRAIPHYKLGRLIRFDMAEVEAWLKAKRVEPLDIDREAQRIRKSITTKNLNINDLIEKTKKEVLGEKTI